MAAKQRTGINYSRKPSPVSKARKFADKLKAKAIRIKARSQLRKTKHEANLQRGGIVGRVARRREQQFVEAKAKRQTTAMKPALAAKAAKTEIETSADVKKATAKYKGYAGVASALGAAYYGGKKADEGVEKAKTAAAEIGAKALQDSLSQVKDVDGEKGNVAGLITGVR